VQQEQGLVEEYGWQNFRILMQRLEHRVLDENHQTDEEAAYANRR